MSGFRLDDRLKHNTSHLLNIILLKCGTTNVAFWVIFHFRDELSNSILLYLHLCLNHSKLSTPIFPLCIPKNSLFGSYSATTNATYLHGNRPAILFLIAVRCVRVWSVYQMTIRQAAPPHSKERQGDVKGETLQYLSLLSSVASFTLHLCSRMCFVLFLACSHVLTQQTLPYSTVSCWYIIHFVHDAFHVFSSAFGQNVLFSCWRTIPTC